jgi:hypothetical protein
MRCPQLTDFSGTSGQYFHLLLPVGTLLHTRVALSIGNSCHCVPSWETQFEKFQRFTLENNDGVIKNDSVAPESRETGNTPQGVLKQLAKAESMALGAVMKKVSPISAFWLSALAVAHRFQTGFARLPRNEMKRVRYAMIIGSHVLCYSNNPEADRAFVRDVLKFPSVDVGGGWLIFKLPPAEAAFHPADGRTTLAHGGRQLLGAVLYP